MRQARRPGSGREGGSRFARMLSTLVKKLTLREAIARGERQMKWPRTSTSESAAFRRLLLPSRGARARHCPTGSGLRYRLVAPSSCSSCAELPLRPCDRLNRPRRIQPLRARRGGVSVSVTSFELVPKRGRRRRCVESGSSESAAAVVAGTGSLGLSQEESRRGWLRRWQEDRVPGRSQSEGSRRCLKQGPKSTWRPSSHSKPFSCVSLAPFPPRRLHPRLRC